MATGYPAQPGGFGFNNLETEPGLRGSKPNGGYLDDKIIPLNDWRTTTGVVLTATAAATPYRAVVSTSLVPITWRQDAAATDLIRTEFPVPGFYDPLVDELQLIAVMRKFDTDDTENPTLNMQAVLKFMTNGQVDPTIAAAATPTAPAAGLDGVPAGSLLGDTALTAISAVKRRLKAATNALSGYAAYSFNLNASALQPLDTAIIEFGPDATVGTTDMKVELIATMLRWTRSASINRRDLRYQRVAIF